MPLSEDVFIGKPITHTDGFSYRVINPSKLNFSGADVQWGKKTALTKVRLGKMDEVVYTNPGGFNETDPFKVTNDHTLIFTNIVTGISFVPPHAAEILSTNYDLIGGSADDAAGAIYKPKPRAIRILHEVVDRRICIKDAFGIGRHQFLNEGDTLKSLEGNVTGIEKSEFDATWRITVARRGPSQKMDHSR